MNVANSVDEISGSTSESRIQEELSLSLSDQRIVDHSWTLDYGDCRGQIVFENVTKGEKLFGIGDIGLFVGRLENTVVEVFNADYLSDSRGSDASDLFVSDVCASANSITFVSCAVEISFTGQDLKIHATRSPKASLSYRKLDLGFFEISW